MAKTFKLILLVAFFAVVFPAFYFHNLSTPQNLYWDETLHVEGARSILYNQKPYVLHAHPPLGKESLVLSLKLFGDNPWGARVLSAISALGCLLFIYFIVFHLTRSLGAAAFSVLLLLFDPLFFVQARIGMLDMFVVFSLLLSFLIFLKLRQNPKRWIYYWFFAFSLAYGLIVKSLLVVFYPLFAFYLYQSFQEKKLSKTYFLHLLIVVLLAPLLLLYLSYAFLGYSISQAWQHLTWGFSFLRTHIPAEAIVSGWSEWLLVQKPMWYLYKQEKELIQTVYLTGNFIFWLVAELCFLMALFFKKLRPQYFWFFFLGVVLQFLFWTLKPGTHFYYMITIVPLYALFMGLFLNHLIRSYPQHKQGIVLNVLLFLSMGLAIFIHYYPLMIGRQLTVEQIQNILQFKQPFFFGE